MRVEVTFAGDSSSAVDHAEIVKGVFKALGLSAEETQRALRDVKVTSGQAAETKAALNSMSRDLRQVREEAALTRLELDRMSRAGRNGVGVGPFGSGFGRVGVLGTAVGLGVATSGPVGAGATALLAGVPGLAATGAAALGTLELAFHGVGAAIGGDQKAFEKLDPQAQAFTQTIRSLIPWVHELQDVAQKGIFGPLTEGLHAGLTPQTAAGVENAVQGIAGALGQVGKEWATGLGSPGFQRLLGNLGGPLAHDLELAGDAAGNFAHGLTTIANAAVPLDNTFAKGLDDASKLAAAWLDNADKSGKLTAGLETAGHELAIVWHFVEALGGAAFDLSRDLTPLGNLILGSLTTALQHFSQWLNQNRQEIGDFTTGALHGIIGAVEFLWPLVDHLAKSLYDLTGFLGGAHTTADILIASLIAWKVAVYGVAAAQKVLALDAFIAKVLGLATATTASAATQVIAWESVQGAMVATVTEEAAVGTAATVAAGEVGILRSALLGLAGGSVLAALGATAAAVAAVAASSGSDPNVPGLPKSGPGATLSALAQAGKIPGSAAGAAAKKAGIDPNTPFGTAMANPKFEAALWAWARSKGLVQGSFAAAGGAGFVGDLGGLGSVAGAGGTPPSAAASSYMGQVLTQLGVPLTDANLNFMNAWAQREGVPQNIDPNNMLGTTLPMGGSYGTNGPGVQAYPSQTAGVKATAAMLKQGNFAAIFGALKSGNAYQFANDPAVQKAFLTWSGGGYSFPTSGAATAGQSPFSTPPPFDPTSKSGALPGSLQLAIAKASSTSGKKDDIAALKAAIAWLQGNVAGFDQEGQIYGYGEIGSLMQQLATLMKTKKAKKPRKPPVASKASLISANRLAGSLGVELDADVFAGVLPVTPEQNQAALAKAQQNLTKVVGQYEPMVKAAAARIKRALTGDETMSPAALATLRARMDGWKNTISHAVDAAKNAARAGAADFQSIWQKFAADASAEFDKATAAYVSPAQQLITQLTDQRNTDQLNQALDQANQDLATALQGHAADAQGQLDRIQQYVGRQYLANAIDAAQSAILGGPSSQTSGQTILDTLHGILSGGGGNVVDPDEVKRAQQEVEDAKFNIQIAGLTKTAAAQQAAWDQQRADQKIVLDNMANDWATYYGKVGGSIAAIKALWVNALSVLDPLAGAGLSSGYGGGGDAQQGVYPAGVSGSTELAIVTAQAALFGGLPANALNVAAAGMQGKVIGFADGGYASSPMLAMVAEKEPEFMIPQSKMASVARQVAGSRGGGFAHLHVSVDQQGLGRFIEAKVVDSTPGISLSSGRAADTRRREGGY